MAFSSQVVYLREEVSRLIKEKETKRCACLKSLDVFNVCGYIRIHDELIDAKKELQKAERWNEVCG